MDKIEKFQITNSKSQINSKSQLQNDQNSFGHWNFGHWCLFGIWCLVLVVCHFLFLTPLTFGEELSLHGFLQTNYAVRVADDNPQGAKQGNLILAEERLQLKSSFYPSKSKIGIFVKADFYHDGVEEDFNADLREGYLDLREDKFGLRLGRQIFTWGVGDLLFINDVFPKDWEAFYSGRPLEYLKMSTDSIKLDYYCDIVSIEAIAIPNFTADNLPSTGRFHYFDPYPSITYRDVNKPHTTFEDAEYALRFYRYIGDYDIGVYLYKGFFRSPAMKADNFESPSTISHFYPELALYGLSAQRSALGGVVGDSNFRICCHLHFSAL